MNAGFMYFALYFFFGLETVICLNRAFNKSSGFRKFVWLLCGGLGIAGGVNVLYAHSCLH